MLRHLLKWEKMVKKTTGGMENCLYLFLGFCFVLEIDFKVLLSNQFIMVLFTFSMF